MTGHASCYNAYINQAEESECIMTKQDIFSEGYAAFVAGEENYKNNRYSGEDAKHWHEGWQAAIDDARCKCTGQD